MLIAGKHHRGGLHPRPRGVTDLFPRSERNRTSRCRRSPQARTPSSRNAPTAPTASCLPSRSPKSNAPSQRTTALRATLVLLASRSAGPTLFRATVVVLCVCPARSSRLGKRLRSDLAGYKGPSNAPLFHGQKSRHGCVRIGPQVPCDLEQLTAACFDLVLPPLLFFADLAIHHQ